MVISPWSSKVRAKAGGISKAGEISEAGDSILLQLCSARLAFAECCSSQDFFKLLHLQGISCVAPPPRLWMSQWEADAPLKWGTAVWFPGHKARGDVTQVVFVTQSQFLLPPKLQVPAVRGEGSIRLGVSEHLRGGRAAQTPARAQTQLVQQASARLQTLLLRAPAVLPLCSSSPALVAASRPASGSVHACAS